MSTDNTEAVVVLAAAALAEVARRYGGRTFVALQRPLPEWDDQRLTLALADALRQALDAPIPDTAAKDVAAKLLRELREDCRVIADAEASYIAASRADEDEARMAWHERWDAAQDKIVSALLAYAGRTDG